VAALGTAMTPEQAQLVTRYASQVLLLYDSDPAGLRATFRSGDEILRAGGHPMVVTLPPGEDPDSLVRSRGSQGLKPYLDNAVDVLERKFQILEERGYFEDVEGVRKALDGLLPTLRAARDATLRDIYVDRVAKRTGVRRETLEDEIRQPVSSGRRAAAQRLDRSEPRRRRGASKDSTERLLLLLLARDPSRLERVVEVVRAEDFRGAVNRELFAALLRGGDSRSDPSLLEGSDEARALLEELLGDVAEVMDPDQSFTDAVEQMLLRPKLDRLQEIQDRLQAARGEEQERLFREKAALTAELAAKTATLKSLGAKVSNRYRRYLKP
jgi:DNA primase